jgi:hypothetical protein
MNLGITACSRYLSGEVEMAKNCIKCHKKIGFLSGYHENEDGSYTCDVCFNKQNQIKELEKEVDQL